MKRILLAFVLVACSDITAPTDGTLFDPPPTYRQWWSELEACSGLRGDFDSVRFYSVPILMRNGVEIAGQHFNAGNRIFLAERYVDDVYVVKHEEMHALLRGGYDHPPWYFAGACGRF